MRVESIFVEFDSYAIALPCSLVEQAWLLDGAYSWCEGVHQHNMTCHVDLEGLGSCFPCFRFCSKHPDAYLITLWASREAVVSDAH